MLAYCMAMMACCKYMLIIGHIVYVCWQVVYVRWHGVSNECYRYVRNVAPQSAPLSLAMPLYRFRICDEQQHSSLIPRPSHVTLCLACPIRRLLFLLVCSQFRYEVNVSTHYEAGTFSSQLQYSMVQHTGTTVL